mmetsp:Transcript_47684/g.102137  ORF Transcript_47684/g.102137 Transcript_47684/m.102137 type:complete len:206 (-) Transcript_47684:8-625(-)
MLFGAKPEASPASSADRLDRQDPPGCSDTGWAVAGTVGSSQQTRLPRCGAPSHPRHAQKCESRDRHRSKGLNIFQTLLHRLPKQARTRARTWCHKAFPLCTPGGGRDKRKHHRQCRHNFQRFQSRYAISAVDNSSSAGSTYRRFILTTCRLDPRPLHVAAFGDAPSASTVAVAASCEKCEYGCNFPTRHPRKVTCLSGSLPHFAH